MEFREYLLEQKVQNLTEQQVLTIALEVLTEDEITEIIDNGLYENMIGDVRLLTEFSLKGLLDLSLRGIGTGVASTASAGVDSGKGLVGKGLMKVGTTLGGAGAGLSTTGAGLAGAQTGIAGTVASITGATIGGVSILPIAAAIGGVALAAIIGKKIYDAGNPKKLKQKIEANDKKAQYLIKRAQAEVVKAKDPKKAESIKKKYDSQLAKVEKEMKKDLATIKAIELKRATKAEIKALKKKVK